ncbi:MAG: sigma-54-dependent Fis family transcriptional regulator [Desulfobulbaceae bacterium S3730MH12]|nr:MAG: sigma-54-dependent Fis family transcriptional regulator [Desulfobulbaceae bacterium S5133MH15]OEU57945.1 MAG: sigma-54-dependent Fis family transcriptional regulator [Desulfobulbaceae bacterium S3730MH12]OEU83358.1 MAG: sigma-54-dependent Fis family transcriptional regulator [Desulfobulbaceae bacterium C00003063]
MEKVLSSAKILIVDDEESIRQTFEIFLTSAGYQFVKAVAAFDQALDALAQTTFDLIICDIVLIGPSGTELLRKIREAGVKCPVVMVTGFPHLESAAESVRHGAFDYISKPVNKETLLRFTKQALKHWYLENKAGRLQRENEKYRRYLETIFRSVGDAIITIDTDMQIVQLNETAEQWLKEKGAEGVFELNHLPAELSLACLNDARKVLQGGAEVRKHLIECPAANNTTRLISLNASPLRGDNEEFQGVVIVARDMTSEEPREINENRSRFHGYVGSSDAMQKVYKLIENIGKVDTAVLITGESGTGKELAAEALHAESARRVKPLIKVDCVSVAENLLESELFGHRKGAFTGADRDRTGRLLQADGGTLFLDEIGDISPRTQLLLLRFLQEKTFTPVGQDEPVQVDVRVIAATNVDFQEMVTKGEFREDLYYRLKVIEVKLPPLRDRINGIPLLANHFLELFRKQLDKRIITISDQAMDRLVQYSWPGNVRELRHVMERACVLCNDPVLLLEHLPEDLQIPVENGPHAIVPAPPVVPEGNLTNSLPVNPHYVSEDEKIIAALRQTRGNKAKAAKLLGIARSTLYRQMQRYNIKD